MTEHKPKGVILAGGTGSRLAPLTNVTNKHLLPVGQQPMIYYPVKKLIQAGICDILIVTGKEHMGSVVSLLGSGADMGCRFTYRVQDEAGGIAQALLLAENFTHGEPMVVILGDNIFQDSLAGAVQDFCNAGALGAHLLVKQVHDPERFGVATIDGDRIVKIEEKPSDPKSNMIVTGIYMYDTQVFDYIRECTPSGRGELEISDVNQHYVAQSKVQFSELSGWWTDAGTFDSLTRAAELVKTQPIA